MLLEMSTLPPPVVGCVFKRGLFDAQGLVLAAVLVERVLDALHDGKYFLFLEALADDLDANGEAVHLVGVVVLVCSFRDAVQGLEAKCGGELVFGSVDVGDGDDAAGVIELVVSNIITERSSCPGYNLPS